MHCCRRFPINIDLITDPAKNVNDGDYILDMLIELEPDTKDEEVSFCTCKHFDGQDCLAYDQRPDMCSL